MAVTIVRYLFEQKTCWGVVDGRDIIPVPQDFETTGDFLRGTTLDGLKALDGPRIPLDRVAILSPVTRNQRFVCQGANYRQHMIESGLDPDTKHYNMIFTKAPSCIVPADTDVVRPRRVRFLDYEVELGLILRRDISGPVTVTPDNLFDFVAGAVIVNDYSARDIQIPEMQFHKGKSFRTFGPVGPFLCLFERDDMPTLGDLELTLCVNGQVRQQDNSRNLVFGPEETLTELSAVHDFATGDLLATGTPAGCALAVPSPARQRLGALLPEAMKWKAFFKIQSKRTQYLQPGDVVETRIRSADGRIDLGVQRNRIVAEEQA
ncbi:fumarylacetoacetate hydrolase [Sandaracinobacter neustonicus]|uniref:Fumarylacetoacetate hydrolase n=1 Tax=Sandaracinobacter neustonicus TaxID=1715348 RepID=A0A501XDB8_9SPHN|nr:fumarylacetoacetate hydrolase family protein [Sandaracinobacter neustonicus]TPE58571.1 fumarylacetoacetate hydrolase [Sandaracinobacter neustonicus]